MKNGWHYYSNTQAHYFNNILHNDTGPAIITLNGSKYWYKHDKLHREDGPAKIYFDGLEAWYYDGEYLGDSFKGYTQQDFEIWKRFRAFI